MSRATVDIIELTLRVLEFLIILLGVIWTYYRFFREGKDKPRIEFYIDCELQGPHQNRYVSAFTIHAINKGRLEYKFEAIHLRIRGIPKSVSLCDWPGREPLLKYPDNSCGPINIIPKKHGHYFVRPNVHQRFSYITSVPEDWAFFVAHVTFKYRDSNDEHTAEKAIRVCSQH